MKAISLWQPWASAMALGWKSIETRHWTTSYRGPLLIHAAKRWTWEERELAEAHGMTDLPLGALVAAGVLVSVHRTDAIACSLSPQELAWGNYGPARYGWRFRDLAALPAPIPYRGAQGFFDVPDDILSEFVPAPAQGALL